MPINTPDKRRNVAGLDGDPTGLFPTGDVGTSDREDWADAYIGFDYTGVFSAPEADFSFTINPYTRRVQFSDLSSDNPEEWAWLFGDLPSGLNESAEQNPVHVFSAYGTFSVKLVATNGAGSGSITKIVEVVDPGMPYSPITNHAQRARDRLVEQFRRRP